MVRISTARPLGGYVLELGLTNGTTRVADVEPYLRGPMLAVLKRDPALFAAVSVDPTFGTVVWPNGADIDPDVLVLGIEPAR